MLVCWGWLEFELKSWKAATIRVRRLQLRLRGHVMALKRVQPNFNLVPHHFPQPSIVLGVLALDSRRPNRWADTLIGLGKMFHVTASVEASASDATAPLSSTGRRQSERISMVPYCY